SRPGQYQMQFMRDLIMFATIKRHALGLVAVAVCSLAVSSVATAAPLLGIRARAFPGGGVKITEVEPGSVADDLGLLSADVILTINGQLVNRGQEAADAVANSGGHVSLVLRHQNFFEQVEADLEEPVPTFALHVDPNTGKPLTAPKAKTKVKNIIRKQ